jgi:hypothetical protein
MTNLSKFKSSPFPAHEFDHVEACKRGEYEGRF